MSDIAKKLRQWASDARQDVPRGLGPHQARLLEESADEIERLREALKYLVDQVTLVEPFLDDDYNPHAAPIAKAYAALREKRGPE